MTPLSYNEEESVIRYLDNEMTSEERSAFETALARNPSLTQALNREKSLRSLGESAGKKIKEYYNADKEDRDEEIAAMIMQAGERWEKENEDSNALKAVNDDTQMQMPKPASGPITKINTWKRLAVAATIGVIALSVILVVFNKKAQIPVAVNTERPDTSKIISDTSLNVTTPTNVAKGDKKNTGSEIDKEKLDMLFAANFKPDVIPPDAPEVLQVSLFYYKDGQYKEALKALEKVDPNASTRGNDEKKLIQTYLSYYKSLSFLATGHPSKAIPELQKAIAENSGKPKWYRVKAEWYLALAYLKAGDTNAAKKWLKQISSEKNAGEYRNKAIKLNLQIR